MGNNLDGSCTCGLNLTSQDPKFTRRAVKYARMRFARFYFIQSSDYYKQDLPDKRTCHQYLETLEDNQLPEEKKAKIRQTIYMLTVETDNILSKILLDNVDRPKFRLHVICILTYALENNLKRWPRIYVDDSKYKYSGNGDLINDSLTYRLVAEVYSSDRRNSEVDFKDVLVDPPEQKRRSKNKFDYRTEQINLDFVKNLTPKIESSIIRQLKSVFKRRKSDGFASHHMIPRKKLEVFYDLKRMCETKKYQNVKPFGKVFEYVRMSQLCIQFLERGLMTTIQPFNTQLRDMKLSTTGNIFYGPDLRLDDEKIGSKIDEAAGVVLSEDNYKAIISLDDQLNRFFETHELPIDEVCQSRRSDFFIKQTIDRILNGRNLNHFIFYQQSVELVDTIFRTFLRIKQNHGLKCAASQPIPFDPRLVGRNAPNESKWFYRHKDIVQKSLPDWLLKLLLDISQELKLVLYIDLNLTTKALLDVEEYTLISNFIASEVEVFSLVTGGERVYQYQPNVIMIVPAKVDVVMSEVRERLFQIGA